MKRLLVSLIVLMSSFCLFSEVFRSNQLAQKLEIIPSVPETGYALDDGNPSVLYLDGKQVRTITTTVTDELTVIIEDDGLGNTTERHYSKGLLVSETQSGPSGNRTTNYSYYDGHLVLSGTYVDGAAVSVTSFLRSPSGEAVIGVDQDGKVRLFSDSYVVEQGTVYREAVPGLVTTGTHTVNADGSITVSTEDRILTYSADGLLLKEVSDSETVTYTYNGKLLSSITVEKGNMKTVERYEDGLAKELATYKDGVISGILRYSESGNILTVYENGEPVAVVRYKMDNRTIESIEYK